VLVNPQSLEAATAQHHLWLRRLQGNERWRNLVLRQTQLLSVCTTAGLMTLGCRED